MRKERGDSTSLEVTPPISTCPPTWKLSKLHLFGFLWRLYYTGMAEQVIGHLVLNSICSFFPLSWEVGVGGGVVFWVCLSISLVAFWSSQLDNKLCITTSTGIKTLGMRNDGCFSDPYKFAWGQNNCPSLLLGLFPSFPLPRPSQRREGVFSRVSTLPLM